MFGLDIWVIGIIVVLIYISLGGMKGCFGRVLLIVIFLVIMTLVLGL